MTSIYNLSWSETSFLAKLQLFFKSRKQEKEKMRTSYRRVQAGGYSALSSTYYSIVGTAFSQLKATFRPKWPALGNFAAWCLTWLPLAAWCYWRMLPLSNRVVELIGYDGMLADQCDIRQSILRCRGKYDEAKECIRVALAKNQTKAHTRGLLRAGLAAIYLHVNNWRDARLQVHLAITEVVLVERQDLRQAARIYRQCADIIDIVEPDSFFGKDLRRIAQEFAQAADAKDQLLKL